MVSQLLSAAQWGLNLGLEQLGYDSFSPRFSPNGSTPKPACLQEAGDCGGRRGGSYMRIYAWLTEGASLHKGTSRGG